MPRQNGKAHTQKKTDMGKRRAIKFQVVFGPLNTLPGYATGAKSLSVLIRSQSDRAVSQ